MSCNSIQPHPRAPPQPVGRRVRRSQGPKSGFQVRSLGQSTTVLKATLQGLRGILRDAAQPVTTKTKRQCATMQHPRSKRCLRRPGYETQRAGVPRQPVDACAPETLLRCTAPDLLLAPNFLAATIFLALGTLDAATGPLFRRFVAVTATAILARVQVYLWQCHHGGLALRARLPRRLSTNLVTGSLRDGLVDTIPGPPGRSIVDNDVPRVDVLFVQPQRGGVERCRLRPSVGAAPPRR